MSDQQMRFFGQDEQPLRRVPVAMASASRTCIEESDRSLQLYSLV
jgi:hypothetical protein